MKAPEKFEKFKEYFKKVNRVIMDKCNDQLPLE